ncbi:Inner membrane assembly complex subunit 17 protein [Rutstroemia sp. NJR-2017a BBW]|nr:Inner membrane assembly complex subunit 17 protein [Rutstroemia sp. NJR-2017a BBW]
MNRITTTLWRGSRTALPLSRNCLQRRFASSETNAATTESPTCSPSGTSRLPSLQRNFYKTFTRPVAKVLLMATFTYQLVYWGWVKLEKDELMEDKRREIRGLEETLERVSGGKVKGEDIRYKGL